MGCITNGISILSTFNFKELVTLLTSLLHQSNMFLQVSYLALYFIKEIQIGLDSWNFNWARRCTSKTSDVQEMSLDYLI